MNQKMGLAIALALCLGAVSVSVQADAAQGSEAAPASGEAQPKKRRLAAAKTKAGQEGNKDAKAVNAAPKGKKRKLASTGKVGAAQAPSTSAAKKGTTATPESPAAEVVPAKAVVEKGVKRPAKATTSPKVEKALAATPAAGQQVQEQGQGVADKAAQTQEGAPPARPWAAGVSQENQQAALKAFREGNALLKDAVFAQAAIKYREALTFWDHPAIHYNLVLALLNLDRPTEVLVHLNKAMAYGPDPLDPEKYEQAKQYKVLTERQLARLVVRCDLEGAVVSMDGQELFVAPGQYEGFVRPGPHSIVAKKEGYMNSEVSPSLVPGVLSEFDMILLSAADATEYRRLWPNWRPWTVFGLGVVVAGLGAGLHVKGRADISDFDDEVNKSYASSNNNVVDFSYELLNSRDSALRNQKIAMAMYGVGGAAIVTGAVLLYLNRLRPYTPETSTQVNPDAPTASSVAPEVSFLPMLAPEASGMMATVRF